MSDDEPFPEVSFYAYRCDCGGQSWRFPVLVDVIVDDRGVNAHWRDGVGWELCDLDPDDFEKLTSVPSSMSYKEYREMGSRQVALANEYPREHWFTEWQQFLDAQLSFADDGLVMAARHLLDQRNRQRLAASRAAAARIGDPDLAASAHRLLAQNWTGTPAELVATAAAVMSS